MNFMKIDTVEVIFIRSLHMMLLDVCEFHENPLEEATNFFKTIVIVHSKPSVSFSVTKALKI